MSTEEMIERCIRKDVSAWDEFIRQYQGLVRKIVYYRLNKVLRNDVDDIVQEVFLTLWKDDKLSKLRDVSRLKGWLIVVTINLTANYGRIPYKRCKMTRSIHEKLSDQEAVTLEDTIPCNQPDPARSAETGEEISYIEEEMNDLKTKERRALRLKVYDGKKQCDVARIMGIPANTVASLVHRARIKVREGIMEGSIRTSRSENFHCQNMNRNTGNQGRKSLAIY